MDDSELGADGVGGGSGVGGLPQIPEKVPGPRKRRAAEHLTRRRELLWELAAMHHKSAKEKERHTSAAATPGAGGGSSSSSTNLSSALASSFIIQQARRRMLNSGVDEELDEADRVELELELDRYQLWTIPEPYDMVDPVDLIPSLIRKRAPKRAWEPCVFDGVAGTVTLPAALLDANQVRDIRSIINADTWRKLSLPERESLMKLLPTPPNLSGSERAAYHAETLEMLFDDKREDFHFGNPVRDFGQRLQHGLYHVKVVAARRQLRAAQMQRYVDSMVSYHHSLVRHLLRRKQELGVPDPLYHLLDSRERLAPQPGSDFDAVRSSGYYYGQNPRASSSSTTSTRALEHADAGSATDTSVSSEDLSPYTSEDELFVSPSTVLIPLPDSLDATDLLLEPPSDLPIEVPAAPAAPRRRPKKRESEPPPSNKKKSRRRNRRATSVDESDDEFGEQEDDDELQQQQHDDMAEEEFEAEEEPLSPVVLTPPSDPNKRRRKRKVDDLYEEPAKPPRKRKPKASSAVIDEAAAAAAAAEREAALKAKEEAARLAEPPECEDAFDEGIEEVVVEEIPDEPRVVEVWALFSEIRSILLAHPEGATKEQILDSLHESAFNMIIPSRMSREQLIQLALNFLSSPPTIGSSWAQYSSTAGATASSASTSSPPGSPSQASASSSSATSESTSTDEWSFPPTTAASATRQHQQQQQQHATPSASASASSSSAPASSASAHYTPEPFVTVDAESQKWSWVQPDPELIHELLQLIESVFYFLVSRGNVIGDRVMQTPFRHQRLAHTIQPTPEEEIAAYRIAEQQRYEDPFKPFVYKFGGQECIVSPVKRTASKRDHFFLKSDRPRHISLHSIVRDAVSRLPCGLGTRADVVTLVRDSQYVADNVTDAQVNSVVSGALDRLHSEKDPCVRYDSSQRLWTYLHKRRRPQDFYCRLYVVPKRKGSQHSLKTDERWE